MLAITYSMKKPNGAHQKNIFLQKEQISTFFSSITGKWINKKLVVMFKAVFYEQLKIRFMILVGLSEKN